MITAFLFFAIVTIALGLLARNAYLEIRNEHLIDELETATFERSILFAQSRELRCYLAARGIRVVNIEADLSELAAVQSPDDIHFPPMNTS